METPRPAAGPPPRIAGHLAPMRLWHLLVVILALGLILAIVRDPVGRIALIVFVTALGEAIIGTTAVLALFQTIGGIGEAKGLFAHAEAVATTALVLIIATTVMSSLALRGCLAGPGVVALSAGPTERGGTTLSRYVPETFPHHWLPAGARAQDLGADRALVSEAAGAADRLGFRARALADRGRRAERGGRRGRGQALHRDDLPDRRPRARGRLPGVRPRHRAQAQAAPERDPQPLPRLAASVGAAAATATSSSTAPSRTAAPCFARRTSPARPQLAELEQQYQKIIGAMTVTFRGQERTLAQMAPFLEETDRAVRQEAWELVRRPPARRTARHSTTCSTR